MGMINVIMQNHVKINGFYSVFVTNTFWHESDGTEQTKRGGKKSRSNKAEGVAVKGHLETRVSTSACFITCVHCLFNTCCGHMDAS